MESNCAEAWARKFGLLSGRFCGFACNYNKQTEMHAYMHIQIDDLGTSTCTHALCTYTPMHIHTEIFMCIFTYIHIYIYRYRYRYRYRDTHLHMCTHTWVREYTHACTSTKVLCSYALHHAKKVDMTRTCSSQGSLVCLNRWVGRVEPAACAECRQVGGLMSIGYSLILWSVGGVWQVGRWVAGSELG